MIIFNGKTKATVMLDNLDDETSKQIVAMTNHPALKENMVIMPDTHAGKGCVIGYTRKLENDIVPNFIGVDIGCGMLTAKFSPVKIKDFDFEKFDAYVKKNVPMGFSGHDKNTLREMTSETPYIDLCKKITNNKSDFERLYSRISSSVGTLGGGNHFFSLDIDEYEHSGMDNEIYSIYATFHSGSRNLGKVVAEYFQDKAVKFCKEMNFKVSDDQAFLPVEYGGDEYIEAMKLSQQYASLNRKKMMEIIVKYFKTIGSSQIDEIECVHNYIDFEDEIVRKGAISAQAGKRLVIPLNMRDGIVLGVGKGNAEWNYSAPHGVGRMLRRSEAKKKVKLEDFQESMKGIYCSSISQDTLDESPFAYKDSKMIIDAIGETVDVEKVIKPIYNIKAGGD